MRAFLMGRYFRLLKLLEGLILTVKVNYTRSELKQARRQYVKEAGRSVMTRKVKTEVRAYARERFGSAAFRPGVELAVERRGAFIRGFIPFDYYYYFLEPKLNPPRYRSLGDLRTLDYRRFGDLAVKPLLLFISGIFFNADFEPVGEQEISRILSGHNDTIIIKQEFGWGGKEVRVMHSSGFKPGLLLPGFNYIIQPIVKQYSVLHNLHPESLNTFRVLTFMKKDGSVEVLLTYLRFGVDGARIDNVSSGGECLLFDPSGKPAKNSFTKSGFISGERHKNTGVIYANLKIPMIHDIRNRCIALHQKYPDVRLVGWDMCVDESGDLKLIEWNSSRPGFDLEDALFGPFLTDDRELE